MKQLYSDIEQQAAEWRKTHYDCYNILSFLLEELSKLQFRDIEFKQSMMVNLRRGVRDHSIELLRWSKDEGHHIKED